MSMTPLRPLVLATLAVALLVGCNGQTPSPERTTSTQTPAGPSAEEEISDLFQAYFAAVVAAEADLDDDPARFADVMTPEAAQVEADFIANLADNSMFRTGEPVVAEDVTVEVDGTTAVAQGCVDHKDWLLGATSGTGVQQPFPPGPQPFVLRVEQQDDGQWLVSETRYGEGATITC